MSLVGLDAERELVVEGLEFHELTSLLLRLGKDFFVDTLRLALVGHGFADTSSLVFQFCFKITYLREKMTLYKD